LPQRIQRAQRITPDEQIHSIGHLEDKYEKENIGALDKGYSRDGNASVPWAGIAADLSDFYVQIREFGRCH
jgi:hypothetical protein